MPLLGVPAPDLAEGQTGFSLLEVLVATLILSLTLVVMLQGQAGGLATQAANSSRLQAALLADKILNDYGQPGKLAPGRFQGQDGPWRYEVEITPQYRLTLTQTETAIACYLLQVKVSWSEKGRQRSLVTRTVRVRLGKS